MASLLLEKTERLGMLSGETLNAVRDAFGMSYNRQMYLAVGLAVVCLPTAMLAWKAPAANAPESRDEKDLHLAKPSPIGQANH